MTGRNARRKEEISWLSRVDVGSAHMQSHVLARSMPSCLGMLH